MSYLHTLVLDRGLEELVRNTTRLAISASEPPDYTAANLDALGSTYEQMQYVAGPPALVVGPHNAVPDGRAVTVGPIGNGNVVVDGTASHWSLLDDVNQRLLASGTLNNSLTVVAGNAFTLTAFDIVLPGS